MSVAPAEDKVVVPKTAPAAAGAVSDGRGVRPPRRLLLRMAGTGVVVALLLYYPVGAWRAHVVDDDPAFAPPAGQAGQSKAVALAAALIRREIDVHAWTPNKPIFMPTAILTDMPNFQMGIAAMIGRFAIEMDERIGRPPSKDGDASASDADLDRAAGLMQYPPTVWMIDPAVPWARTLSTEKQYRNAAWALEAYNLRLAAGTASFARGAPALLAVVERFAKELDGTAALLEGPIDDGGSWFSRSAGPAFFNAKGRAYAALLLLRALGEDYRPVLAERNLAASWRAMLASLTAAAVPKPWLVFDGDAASLFVPNHLAVQGYHLLRAKGRLIELAEGLR